MRRFLVAVLMAGAFGVPAMAAPCGAGGEGTQSIHYDTGKTGLTSAHKAKLATFIDIAKHRTAVCVFAQVDAQGTEAANKRVANARAENVKRYLIQQGVKADRIQIAKEEESFTLFGLLDEDSKNDRRVTVSYE